MDKSPEAFRTISEVADWLDVPTHVLRFWESRFAQVKPVKRAGGRRYYRPADMRLIGGIKKLLHEDGMTIRGVQKLLREEGVKHVASLSQPFDHEEDVGAGAGETLDAKPPSSVGPSEPDPLPQTAGPTADLPGDEGGADQPEPETSAPVSREAEPAAAESDADAVDSEEAVSLPFIRRTPPTDVPGPQVEVLRDDAAAIPASPVAPEEVEADAAWSAEVEAVESDETPADADDTPDAAPTRDREPASSEPEALVPTAGALSFGSVRGRAALQDELPFGSSDETEREAAPESTRATREHSEPTFPESAVEPDPIPEAPREAEPLLSDAPEADPEDDAPDHARPHGATALLVLRDRSALHRDPIRLEQVVAALRAVRDRSAS